MGLLQSLGSRHVADDMALKSSEKSKLRRLHKVLAKGAGPALVVAPERYQGQKGSAKSEVIDLVTGKTCDSLEDYPVGTLGGTGALLDGLYPLVCGGYVSERPNTNQCKILGSSGEYVSNADKIRITPLR